MNAILPAMHKRCPWIHSDEKSCNESLDLLSHSGGAMAEAITLESGDKSPLFDAPDSKGEHHNLTELISAGNKVILYFYPRDSTPGCTVQACDFRDDMARLSSHGYKVFGVSKDSLKSHESFKDKFKFPFELISDPDEKVCRIFDVIKEKSMYGKKYMGIERSTFLIDSNGKLIEEWRKVKVKGHVEEVLSALD